MTNVAVVINPRAGKGFTDEAWDELVSSEPGLASARILREPDAAGARRAIAEALASGVERFVVMGGDGSIHLAANVILELGVGRRVVIGVVPTGTGSDFARVVGVPSPTVEAVHRALTMAPRSIDALRVEADDGRRVFVINVFSAGISGHVVQEVNRRSGGGALSYLLATLGAIWRYRPVRSRILVDGALLYEGELLLLAVANGKAFGRGMQIAPDAQPDDGQLDVVCASAVSRWELPFRLPQLYRGTHLHLGFVEARRGVSVRLEPLSPMPAYDIDGETFPSAPVAITVEPNALRIA